jgi:DNA polymerase
VDKKLDVEMRQFGKNTVLGCGFQMGAPTFQRKYARKRALSFCEEIIKAYRKEWAPNVPDMWYALQDASTEAVWSGRPITVYGVTYYLEGRWLTARLPSGRKLFYFDPQTCQRSMPWSTPEKRDIRPSWHYSAVKNGHWRHIYPHGGHLAENVVQALARDLMVAAMFRLEENGFPIVLTVHDEIVSEKSGAVDEKAYEQIMMERPQWAKELRVPVKVETWAGDRYRK